jgi:hypothetical protein
MFRELKGNSPWNHQKADPSQPYKVCTNSSVIWRIERQMDGERERWRDIKI